MSKLPAPDRMTGDAKTPSAGACVVIAMHNEASVIAGVVADVLGRFARVVCVDDGSTDGSAEVARLAGAEVVQHPVNLGQGAALVTGIRFSLRSPDVTHVVTFDADGQHDVHDAARMVQVGLDRDVQVVLGTRFAGGESSVPAGRRVLLRAAARFSRATTGLSITDAHNGLRVLRRDAAEQLTVRLHGMSHASEILSQVASRGWSYTEVPVTIAYTDYSRAKGQRAYNALNIAFDVAMNRLRHAS